MEPNLTTCVCGRPYAEHDCDGHAHDKLGILTCVVGHQAELQQLRAAVAAHEAEVARLQALLTRGHCRTSRIAGAVLKHCAPAISLLILAEAAEESDHG